MCISLCNCKTLAKKHARISVVMRECGEFNSANGKHCNLIIFKLL